jgi:Leucine carboxyl methyltransferase
VGRGRVAAGRHGDAAQGNSFGASRDLHHRRGWFTEDMLARALDYVTLLLVSTAWLVERVHVAQADNDSWDLATNVGATATMVAAYRAAATKRDQPLIHDPFAEPLVRAVGMDFFTRLAGGELDAVADDAGQVLTIQVDVPGAGWP